MNLVKPGGYQVGSRRLADFNGEKMKLIVNTISSVKINPSKIIRKGKYQFSTAYLELGKTQFKTWKSKVIKNPTEGNMMEEAQKFLDETDDWHAYLEDFTVGEDEIEMHFGS